MRASGRVVVFGWGRRLDGRRRRPAAGCGPGGAGKKKSRASGPARVDQVGMSGCSVLAPTGHRGQSGQTGAEEKHGGGLGDGGRFSYTAEMRDLSRFIILI